MCILLLVHLLLLLFPVVCREDLLLEGVLREKLCWLIAEERLLLRVIMHLAM